MYDIEVAIFLECKVTDLIGILSRRGGVVNVFSYTLHAQTDCWATFSPLLFPSFFPSYCDVS
jgi:hypothetical protein